MITLTQTWETSSNPLVEDYPAGDVPTAVITRQGKVNGRRSCRKSIREVIKTQGTAKPRFPQWAAEVDSFGDRKL
jgi:hypothetical protein